ncbi:hypothetical protein BGZ57DRAFT_117498 [Hyaloscypha finlandica]|nr:hypothetical protein BGZ57DRAFT_117498 [Hyaloscypha finlandica]
MFVFHTEENPHSSSTNFRQGDYKGNKSAVLQILGVYCIKYPVESKDGVKDHRKVIQSSAFVTADIAEEALRGVRLHERPIHDKIPYRYREFSRWIGGTEKDLTGINSVYCSKGDENRKVFPGSVDSIDAESDIIRDRREIFAAVDEMRKYVFCILVTTNALQRTPDAGKGREKPKKP